MRWPLRLQLFLPTMGVLLAATAVASGAGAWLAARRVDDELHRRLRDAAQVFQRSNYPLQANVLKQAASLTGAQFVAQPQGRSPVASDDAFLDIATKETSPDVVGAARLSLSRTAKAAGQDWLHGVVDLDRTPVGGSPTRLHVFYPERERAAARGAALWPALIGGVVASIAMLAVTFWVATRLTNRIRDLQAQAATIAEGNYAPRALPATDDELRDLAGSLERMAQTLQKYEQDVRSRERLATLATLGAGIAHQIRNAATGARIALDVRRAVGVPSGDGSSDDESLDVAQRQLEAIESYVQRFLAYGRPSTSPAEAFDLREAAMAAVELTRPLAKHLGVEWVDHGASETIALEGDPLAFQQALVNLTTNAIEAAATTPRPVVGMRTTIDGRRWKIEIDDSGPGPAPEIAARLFEPFATDKRGGTGLGLSIARQTAKLHGADVSWRRDDGRTVFQIAGETPARPT